MGQRPSEFLQPSGGTGGDAPDDGWQIALFDSALGWFAVLGREGCVARLTFGHRSRVAAATGVLSSLPGGTVATADWCPGLRDRLQRYADGEPCTFDDVEIPEPASTPFRQRVRQLTRAIPRGQTLSYGELAARAGRPGAARAVGTVMSTNPVPLIVPCHRVIGAGGKLGGYSAPSGIELKRRLLAMESEAAGVPQ